VLNKTIARNVPSREPYASIFHDDSLDIRVIIKPGSDGERILVSG